MNLNTIIGLAFVFLCGCTTATSDPEGTEKPPSEEGAAGQVAGGGDVDGEGKQPDGEWLREDDLDSTRLKEISIKRQAIKMGLRLGKRSYGDQLNLLLGSQGGSWRYSRDLDENGYILPKSNTLCPFLAPEPEEDGLEDCRSILDRATVAAQGEISALKARNPLDGTEFETDREGNEFWWEEGIRTGVKNEPMPALKSLKEVGLCDRQVTRQKSAYEAGIEAGRQLYTDRLNERLYELGQTPSYPEIVPTDVCEVDRAYTVPAQLRSNEDLNDYIMDNPLCEQYSPTGPDEINRYQQAEQRYQQGVEDGILTEYNQSTELLFNVVPCTVSDPLVLDLNGDGVEVLPPNQGVEFKLFGGDFLHTGWIRGDDAFLALDLNQNGRIDDGHELFVDFEGPGWVDLPSGFSKLVRLDKNGDGWITQADPDFDHLLLWQDQDRSGKTEPGELRSLTEAGILALGLSDGGDEALFLRDAAGTLLKGTGLIHDIFFSYGASRLRF